MAVKVLIERTAKPGLAMKLPPLLRELRSDAVRQKGYLYGETLRSVDKPETFLVVSTWSEVTAWKKWADNPIRQRAEAQIAPLLVESPVIRLYQEYFDNTAAISRKT
jgi:quinol monooxygenase YgiN